MEGQFPGGRRFARTLQAGHHHHRRAAHEGQADFGSAEEILQLVADDLRDLLSGRERAEHILPECPLPNAVREFLDHFEVNVGFQESDPDLLQRVLNVPLVEAAFAAQRLEDAIHLVGKVVEHSAVKPSRVVIPSVARDLGGRRAKNVIAAIPRPGPSLRSG